MFKAQIKIISIFNLFNYTGTGSDPIIIFMFVFFKFDYFIWHMNFFLLC